MDENALSQNEINAISTILDDAGYLPGKNLSWSTLTDVPEFMVLALIWKNELKSVSSEELEKEIEQSLAMVLSNLAADDIIVQSLSTYRWSMSPKIKDKIDHLMESAPKEEVSPKSINKESSVGTSVDIQLLSIILENTSYVSGNSLDLDTIEGEIIKLLLSSQKLRNDQFTESVSDPSRISLALSNLQADGIITQNSDYSWSLSPVHLQKLKELKKLKEAELEQTQRDEELRAKIDDGKLILLDNPDYRYLIEAIKDSSFMRNVHPSQNLAEIPEFEVLAQLFKHDSLTTNQLEQKFELGSSLSLTLSNLKADRFITSELDTWKLDRSLLSKIDEVKRKYANDAVVREQKAQQEKEVSMIEKRNLLVKYIISSLGKRGINYTDDTQNAFSIPEIEILYYLAEEGALSTSELESKVKNTSSLSLVLSNLQADRIITQDTKYRWEIDPSILHDIQNLGREDVKVIKKVVPNNEVQSTELLREKEVLSEKLKLRKILFEIGVISSSEIPIPELEKRTDFEILSVILQHQPIETSEIENLLSKQVLLSMELSNLNADDMIYYSEGESKWRISPRLQSKLRKTVLDEKEILDELSSNVEESEEIKVATPKSLLSDFEKEIIRILQNKGYSINEELNPHDQNEYPEYIVFKLICRYGPIDLNTLTDKAKGLAGLTLTLSNLSADNLILEDNYFYIANPEVIKSIDHIKDLVSEEEEVIEDIKGEEVNDENAPEEKNDKSKAEIQEKLEEAKRRAEEQRRREAEEQKRLKPFINATHSLGYISSNDLPHSAHLNIPEYEVLYTIFENDGASIDIIKQKVEHCSPVIVSRTLNRLQADEVIDMSDDGKVTLNSKFRDLLP